MQTHFFVTFGQKIPTKFRYWWEHMIYAVWCRGLSKGGSVFEFFDTKWEQDHSNSSS
ncbi:hypothetical protein VCHA55P509_70038 [Vibrio chagasii]|nr:hypothetical protein VCHA55P509_70038 [Vibrio chagasii]